MIPRLSASPPIAAVAAALAILLAGASGLPHAARAAPASSTDLTRLPTVEELAQGRPPATVAPARPPAAPAPRLPTVEDIVRGTQGGPGAAKSRPTPPAGPAATALGTLPTVEELATRGAPSSISCQPPQRPGRPPDGRTATEAEMLKAQGEFRTYVAAGEAFKTCVFNAQKAAFARLTVAEFLTLEQLERQAQFAIELEAERFNEQVRLFRGRAQAPK